MPSDEEKGKRLGFLIASLDTPPDHKEALLSLLSQMTEPELQELTEALETSYLQAVTKQQDEQFINTLKSTEENFEQKIDQINSETIKELDSIA